MKANDFILKKQNNKKITLVTSYDYWSAKIISKSKVDCILVGDSGSMVMRGDETTVPATIELMCHYTISVRNGAPKSFIITDMPFLSYRKGLAITMENVQQIIQAGANAIKIEGVYGNEEIIKYIVQSGVPVMGHIGLTPQFINHIGSYKVQGREQNTAESLIKQALLLQDCGVFSIVLECVPAELAKKISEKLTIPTIGIGAGNSTDGQVLVLHDLLGLNPDFNAKFVKKYLNGSDLVLNALNSYADEVSAIEFPSEEHSF